MLAERSPIISGLAKYGLDIVSVTPTKASTVRKKLLSKKIREELYKST